MWSWLCSSNNNVNNGIIDPSQPTQVGNDAPTTSEPVGGHCGNPQAFAQATQVSILQKKQSYSELLNDDNRLYSFLLSLIRENDEILDSLSQISIMIEVWGPTKHSKATLSFLHFTHFVIDITHNPRKINIDDVKYFYGALLKAPLSLLEIFKDDNFNLLKNIIDQMTTHLGDDHYEIITLNKALQIKISHFAAFRNFRIIYGTALACNSASDKSAVSLAKAAIHYSDDLLSGIFKIDNFMMILDNFKSLCRRRSPIPKYFDLLEAKSHLIIAIDNIRNKILSQQRLSPQDHTKVIYLTSLLLPSTMIGIFNKTDLLDRLLELSNTDSISYTLYHHLSPLHQKSLEVLKANTPDHSEGEEFEIEEALNSCRPIFSNDQTSFRTLISGHYMAANNLVNDKIDKLHSTLEENKRSSYATIFESIRTILNKKDCKYLSSFTESTIVIKYAYIITHIILYCVVTLLEIKDIKAETDRILFFTVDLIDNLDILNSYGHLEDINKRALPSGKLPFSKFSEGHLNGLTRLLELKDAQPYYTKVITAFKIFNELII